LASQHGGADDRRERENRAPSSHPHHRIILPDSKSLNPQILKSQRGKPGFVVLSPRRFPRLPEETAVAKKTVKKKSARKPNAAFMRPVTPSDTLAEVVGPKAIPRTEVTKKLWAYIKKNGLQDKKNKRMINADDNLKAVFGGKSSVNMFAMTKLVSKHLK
jgi:chromatin remodeling complex protein RSC6